MDGFDPTDDAEEFGVHEFRSDASNWQRRRNGGGGPATLAEPASCALAITDVELNDVDACDYYQLCGCVPSVGTAVAVRFQLNPGRIVVETRTDRMQIGYLPIKYLHLRRCTHEGWTYSGRILAADSSSDPSVRIDLIYCRPPVE